MMRSLWPATLVALLVTLLALLLHGFAPAALAQEPEAPPLPPGHPPLGPRDVIVQAAEQRQAAEQAARARAMPQDSVHRGMGGAQGASTGHRDESLAAGTLAVQVVDAQGGPLSGVTVDVGIRAGDDRDRRAAETGEDGRALFSGLATGQAQAYRVNMRHDGAVTSSVPFRLPLDSGYAVQITRLPTTRDDSAIYLLSRAFLEVTDTRLKVVRHVRLLNDSSVVYVLPEAGRLFALPDGFSKFQSEEVMTDQRLAATDAGFRLRGSLPPGQTQLIWAYEIPLAGGVLEFDLPAPFPVLVARVEVGAAPGMALRVTGLPDAELHEHEGRRSLATETQRSLDEPLRGQIEVRLLGIPGPGPQRWVALALALALLALGLVYLSVPGRKGHKLLARARTQRKNVLLDEVAGLERLFEQDEVGPKYHARERRRLTTELAALLRDEAGEKAPG